MKLVQIPENTNDLRNYEVFLNAVKEFKEFQKNINTYCEKIVIDTFLKTPEQWKFQLKEEDLNNFEEASKYKLSFFNYKTSTLVPFRYGIKPSLVSDWGWIMGNEWDFQRSYDLDETGQIIEVKVEWKSQSSRFSHTQTINNKVSYYINLVDKSVV